MKNKYTNTTERKAGLLECLRSLCYASGFEERENALKWVSYELDEIFDNGYASIQVKDFKDVLLQMIKDIEESN